MTLEYKRKYITPNVVMLGFVGESLFSKSADAASAAPKLNKKSHLYDVSLQVHLLWVF